jgi:hypothetical protein
MTKTYTEFCQGKLGASFTGVVRADSGTNTYAAVVNGQILKSPVRGLNRWFKTAAAAQAAIPVADLSVDNQGSICLLRAKTEAGRDWVAEHIPADAQWWCGGVVVEPRYIDAIVDGAMNDGLEVA